MSAAKLDCENESTSPIQSTAIPAVAAAATFSAGRASTTTRQAMIATTRKRP